MLHLQYDSENSNDFNTSLKVLRYYRTLKVYSTRKLTEKVGVLSAAITLYENDKNPIRHRTAISLADILQIKRKLLLDEYGKL